MKKILIHPLHKRQIADELCVTTQTVDMSLKYVFDSPKAKEVRKRAKELLEKEILNIVID